MATSDDWPPVSFSYADRGKAIRVPPATHAKVMQALRNAARSEDIHPWEFLAGEFFLQNDAHHPGSSEDTFPPIARACRELLTKRQDVLPLASRRLADGHRFLSATYRTAIGPFGADTRAQISLASADPEALGDLPVARLISHGRDALMTALVDRLAHGDGWAATALARIGMGDDRSPS